MRRLAWIIVAACFPLLLLPGATAQRRDYMSPELRARVEKLKTEAGAATDSAEVLLERLRTLWAWSNAYALSGGPLPLDYSQMVASANRALHRRPVRKTTTRYVSSFIARMTSEFRIKDERPDAIGSITFSRPGPFIAGDYITIAETYTVGEMPMAPGGGILVAQSSRWTSRAPAATELEDPVDPRSLRLQATDPAGDNYVSITCSNPAAAFKKARPRPQWRSFNVIPVTFFQLEGTTLRTGDTITITFGDTSGGSKGMRVQHWSNDRVLLPIFPDLEGKGLILTPRWPSFRVIGRPEIRRVTAIVKPSVVEPGESFELAVRSEDVYRNPASGTTPEYEVLLNGEPFRTAPSGSEPVTILKNLKLEQPGVYRFTVRTRDGSLACRSNPLWVVEDPEYRVYWGDTHGHSGFADGQGSPENYFHFARDLARLDFVTLSEHDIWLDDWEWRTLQQMTEKYADPGRFTPILGYEWTANTNFGGHHNVYFRSPQGRKRVAGQEISFLSELYAGLRKLYTANEVLVIPHAHNPGDWRMNDAELERLVETNSGHGVFEWFGNRYLLNGYDVGFVGSSDDHTGHPGYFGITHVQMGGLAAVLAPANTAETIFNAMRGRSTYATTGERILIDATLNGARIGQHVQAANGRTIRCRVMGTAPIEAVDVIKNGKVIYSRSPLAPKINPNVTVEFTLESSSEVFTYARPRGPKQWRGTIEVNGARLARVTRPWFANPTKYLVKRDPENPNRLAFLADTRGRGKGMLLELAGATRDTQIRAILDSEARPGSSRPRELAARLAELLNGPARLELRRDRNVDGAQFSLVPDDAPLELEFEFSDFDEPQAGDYYYVRVRQVGGGLALASPWRVGQ